ncbi:MAG TPA: O-antigen ligase family protein [Candidatus Acidoferrum sp.]|nr:O-antigen ligase family protein [Candidatus Acidoferrum sp.]
MRPFLGRLGGYIPAAIALALPVAFLPAVEDSFILPRVSIVIIGACLGAGLALIVPTVVSLETMRWPVAAAAGAAIVAFVFSISWPLSLAGAYTRYESLPIRIAYLGLFTGAVWHLRTKRQRDLVVTAFVFGTAVACLEALLQWAQHMPYRPDGNLGNANLLGALIAMAFPLAIARGLHGDRFTVAWWLAAAAMAGGLLATTSRSGALGALSGSLVLIVLAFRSRRWAVLSGLAAGAVASAALWAIVAGPLSQLNGDPAQSRLQLWPDALHMIVARPLTGWGEDATGLVFGRFLTADWAPGVTYDRTHSGILEIGATQGFVGLIALTVILVVLFRAVLRHRLTDPVASLGAACVGYTVWVLFNFDWAPATGAFWLLAGTLWSAIRSADADQVARPDARVPAAGAPAPWRSATAIGLALAAIGLGALPLLADAWYLQGRAELAVRIDPLQARYHWALGQAFVAHGSQAEGVVELRRAADLGETEPGLYVELGDAEAQLGRTADARGDYRQALVIDPYYAPASQRLAVLGS